MKRHAQLTSVPGESKPRWPALFREVCIGIHDDDPHVREESRSQLWYLVDSMIYHYVWVHASRYGKVPPEDVRDVASQTALAILTRIENGSLLLVERDAAQIAAYFSSAAHRGLLRLFRKAGRHTEPLEELDREGAPPPVAARSQRQAPEKQLDSKEYAAAMQHCADLVDARARRVWFFRVFYEMSSKDIAAHPEVRLKANHVDVILQRARTALRECMQGQGYDTDFIPEGVLTRLWRAYRLPVHYGSA